MGRAVIDTATRPEVFASDVVEQCVSTGVSRRAAPGRTRLLLLIDDVSDPAPSDHLPAAHSNARALFRQLLECHGIPTPEMLSMAASGRVAVGAVLGQYKVRRLWQRVALLWNCVELFGSQVIIALPVACGLSLL